MDTLGSIFAFFFWLIVAVIIIWLAVKTFAWVVRSVDEFVSDPWRQIRALVVFMVSVAFGALYLFVFCIGSTFAFGLLITFFLVKVVGMDIDGSGEPASLGMAGVIPFAFFMYSIGGQNLETHRT